MQNDYTPPVKPVLSTREQEIISRQMHRRERSVLNATSLLVRSNDWGAITLVADTSGDRDLICVLVGSAC